MIAVAVAERVGLAMREVGQHQDLLADSLQRLQGRRQLEPGALT
jgi:hypothetical protein